MAHFAASFAEGWHHHDDFSFSAPVAEDKRCPYAQRFAEQAEIMCQPAFSNPSHITINQALLQVCKKYWEWFYVVPKSHRNRVGDRFHVCIHATFRLYYERLKTVELGLAPAMLFLPPPPPPAPPPSSAQPPSVLGITLGEVLDEE